MRFSPVIIVSLACLATLFFSVEARAQQYITLGAGAFDVLDDEANAQFSLEYRGDYAWQRLRPVLGVSVDTDGGTYGYAGGNWDIPLFGSDRLLLIPNFVVGAYHQGNSKDLGGALEFRSGLELGYRFDNDAQLGLTFNHISNASIYDENPGAESLMLLYSHPVASIW